MNLKERIEDDMKSAMRARDAARLGTIRFLLAAIKQREIDERIDADDALVTAIVERQIKQRKDSIEQFGQAGRTDLAQREQAELELLRGYLPQPLTQEALRAAIDAAVAEAGVGGPQAMGKVMAMLKSRLAGRADMSVVSALVKSRLAS